MIDTLTVGIHVEIICYVHNWNKMVAEKVEALEHAHSGLPLLLGPCLFSFEAGKANSCHQLHL